MKCNVELLHQKATELDLDVPKFAALTGISVDTAKRAWAGCELYFSTICEIAKALKVDIAELTGEILSPGKWLAYNRISRGLSRGDLAERAGVSDGTLANWECGNDDPKLWNAFYVATALGLTIEECFGLSEGAIT